MSHEPVLQCADVAKRYGKAWALRDFDMELRRGEVHGLLGPNGAGKTTLIRILLGLATPTAGRVHIFGLDLFSCRREVMRQVGAVVEAPIFFEYLSAWDNLRHLVSLAGGASAERIEEVLTLVGLRSAAPRRVGTYSYGMKQRLGIAQAMLPKTRFLILDEPTNGLDPHGIAGMRELIQRLAHEQSMTILISSHILSEIEQVCDHVTILHRGCKMLTGGIDALRQPRREVRVALRDGTETLARVRRLTGGALTAQAREDGLLLATFAVAEDGVPGLVAELVAAGMAVERVEPHRRTLEEVFLETTHHGADDVGIDSFRD